jgi:hypothetical protein
MIAATYRPRVHRAARSRGAALSRPPAASLPPAGSYRPTVTCGGTRTVE